MSFILDPALLLTLASKTAIITGAANGIGLHLAQHLHAHGANVVIADLPSARPAAEAAIKELESINNTAQAIFVPVDITVWADVQRLFRAAVERFGRVDVVVANAGIMETRRFFDFEVDETTGELRDDGSGKVVDVNLKGTMNTLRLAVFHMQANAPDSAGWRGFVVLVSSTSGYFGSSEVVSYVSSKHGVMGLLRSSHAAASRLGIRVNAVAPFITPTHITAGYTAAWAEEGLPANTPADVAKGIAHMALNPALQGKCCLVVSGTYRELEGAVAASLPALVGEELASLFRIAGEFFRKLGGYPLPKPRVS